MSMGYGANYADVIKTETLATIVGDLGLTCSWTTTLVKMRATATMKLTVCLFPCAVFISLRQNTKS